MHHVYDYLVNCLFVYRVIHSVDDIGTVTTYNTFGRIIVILTDLVVVSFIWIKTTENTVKPSSVLKNDLAQILSRLFIATTIYAYP
jgi:hypothetical protein